MAIYTLNKTVSTNIHKILVTTLTIILSLFLSCTTNPCFATNTTTNTSSTNSTNTSFFNNTTAMVATAAGVLGIGGAIIAGLLSNNSNNNSSATQDIYTVTPSGDNNETISPSSSQSVAYGSTKTFAVTPSTGYAVSSTVTGTCPTGSWLGSNYTTGAITADCTTIFSATQNHYTVTYSGGNDSTGTAPIDSTAYTSGATVPVLASSDVDGSSGLRNSGKVLAGWSTSASSTQVDYVPGATFSITSNTTLTAVWKAPDVGMLYPNGGGIIVDFTASPNKALIMATTDANNDTTVYWATRGAM